MVIELLGTPSCGKSTFVNSVIKKTGAIAPLDMYLYNSSRIIQNCNKVRLSLFAFCFYYDKARYYNKVFNMIEFPSKTKKIKMWLYVFSVIGAIWKAKKKFPKKKLKKSKRNLKKSALKSPSNKFCFKRTYKSSCVAYAIQLLFLLSGFLNKII